MTAMWLPKDDPRIYIPLIVGFLLVLAPAFPLLLLPIGIYLARWWYNHRDEL